jgi:hypothetical protein
LPLLSIPCLQCNHHSTILHLSLHEYLSNLNWFLKIHPLRSQAHQTTILIIKADLRNHDHHSQ